MNPIEFYLFYLPLSFLPLLSWLSLLSLLSLLLVYLRLLIDCLFQLTPNFELSLFSALLLGGFGLVIGYLTRIVKKFEDRKDEVYLKFLPSLNQSISSFIEAKDLFVIDSNLSKFFKSIGEIKKKLDERMFSGEMLFVEEEVQKKLFAFQSELRMFQVLMERAKISDQNAPDDETERLKDAFQKEIGYTDPEFKPIFLVNHAYDIKLMLNSEIRKYNSILDRLIIMFLIGAAVAAIKFFGK